MSPIDQVVCEVSKAESLVESNLPGVPLTGGAHDND